MPLKKETFGADKTKSVLNETKIENFDLTHCKHAIICNNIQSVEVLGFINV